MNFLGKNWDADHAKYIKKRQISADIFRFQAPPLLEMTDEHIRLPCAQAFADDAA